MIQNPENPWAKESFVCDCGGHHLVMTYFPKDAGKDPFVETPDGTFSRESLYVCLNIPHGLRSFWERVKLCWKIITDHVTSIEEVELAGEDVDRFLKFQSNVLEIRKTEKEKHENREAVKP